MIITVTYKHWKKPEVILEAVGTVLHDHPKSDRIVLRLLDGTYEDILKSTIVNMDYKK